MAENPTQAVQPYLLYEDAGAAVDWLTQAFGLTERFRMADEAGAVNHAEVELDANNAIMLGSPGPDYRSPANSGHNHSQIYAYVEDVDAHFARAKAAGATILEEPADQFYGDRRYGALDCEGHQWYFATHVRDVSPEDMQAGG